MPRIDHQYIGNWVAARSRILDLGCEDGELLAYLRTQKNTHGIGVDKNNTQLTHCMHRGLQAIHMDIQEGLSLFESKAFDYVILSQTLQSMSRQPQVVVREMLRIGKTAIVSFPNFGYWRLRWQLLFGNMPVGRYLPHQWHNTPYVRYCTVADFEQWCQQQQFFIHNKVFLRQHAPVQTLPNWRAMVAIYQLSDCPR